MKTIKVVNSPNGKSVKKILFNRSRSGNQLGINTKKTSRPNVSPFRNSIGLKSYHQPAAQNPNQHLITPNEDYYQLQNKHLLKKMQKCKNNILHTKTQKKLIQKHILLGEVKEFQNTFYGSNTEQDSKFSSKNLQKSKFTDSEYFLMGYLSPSSKLKQLQKQKCLQKKKVIKNLQKVIRIDQEIRQSRSKHQLQTQIFEQLISNLKKQTMLAKSSKITDQKDHSKLKNSGSLDTEQGESSNQY